MNVLALATRSRPALLKIYLEQLLKSDELKNYIVYFFVDPGFDPEVLNVIRQFRKSHKNIKIKLRSEVEFNKSPLKGFYNIVDSYKVAAEIADEYVLIGEEDIIPSRDYLTFNRVVYEEFLSRYDRIFCLAHKKRWETEKSGDPNVLVGDQHCTLPSCLSVKAIKKYMLPYLTDELYSHPPNYYALHFPGVRLEPNDHIHCDGFIERIIYKHDLFSLMPDQARSMHVGVSGNNIAGKKEITGTVEEKYAKYKELIKDGDALREYTTLPRDICVIDPDGYEFDKLRIDLDRVTDSSTILFDPENKFKEYINACTTLH
jgi:hypothetical protein